MEPEKYYHIYTHANGTENLFRKDENFRYFLLRYEHFIAPVADTLAWCLMPNHLHLLVRVKPMADLLRFFKLEALPSDLTGLGDLSGRTIRQFSHLFNAYTKAYNKVYQRRGSLFTRSFRRKEVTNNRYFTQLIFYIHTNPVHHGFTPDHTSWPWSSFQELLLAELTPIQQEVIEHFGGRQQFVEFHRQPPPPKFPFDD